MFFSVVNFDYYAMYNESTSILSTAVAAVGSQKHLQIQFLKFNKIFLKHFAAYNPVKEVLFGFVVHQGLVIP